MTDKPILFSGAMVRAILDDYERDERIAIKIDSGIPEAEAIRQTDEETRAAQTAPPSQSALTPVKDGK